MEDTSTDPYQTPQEWTPPPAFTQVSVLGSCLLVPRDYTFPPICLKTGETEELTKPITRKLTWYHPAWAFLLLINLIVFIIVVLCVQKTGKVTFYLTDNQRRQHRRRLLITWLVFLACVPMIFLAVRFEDYAAYAIIAAVVAVLTSLIMAATWARLIAPRRIDQQSIHFSFKDPAVLQRVYAACESASRRNAL
jgi:Na+/melibiose symporter-like transporter